MRSKTRSESVTQQRAEMTVLAVFNLSACIGAASQIDALPMHGTPRPAQANALNPKCF
jgi:hypothetical protein